MHCFVKQNTSLFMTFFCYFVMFCPLFVAGINLQVFMRSNILTKHGIKIFSEKNDDDDDEK